MFQGSFRGVENGDIFPAFRPPPDGWRFSQAAKPRIQPARAPVQRMLPSSRVTDAAISGAAAAALASRRALAGASARSRPTLCWKPGSMPTGTLIVSPVLALRQGRRADSKLNSGSVIDALSDLFVLHGIPSFIRSDNGPEFVAQAMRDWLGRLNVKTLYIEPGSRWENGYRESSNGKPRDECLNWEIFYSLRE